eukprot:gnl/TRDRNA2_/TRDRNA2_84851_c0_seq1.p1 gnl/TRDRNA2_/TRDRNA2_84851_c0~~gnl/TRDRNA2_/TRDRNA2_84851_c0_seq1.p1  ORF type:complete len:461 (-),score=60.03 gnl/TRDRNA2_/TRDRNA2_84851_c0_seq1:74-1456(-)
MSAAVWALRCHRRSGSASATFSSALWRQCGITFWQSRGRRLTHSLYCDSLALQSSCVGYRCFASLVLRAALPGRAVDIRHIANFGAPPRLRLMEKGWSYDEASIICRAIEEHAKAGSSYEEAWRRAISEIRQRQISEVARAKADEIATGDDLCVGASSAADTPQVGEQLALDLLRETDEAISSLQGQLRDPAEADSWTLRGTALLAITKQQWHPGLTSVEVPDFTKLDVDGRPLTLRVDLDPRKDFRDNANACFKRARKISQANEQCTPLIEKEEANLARWKKSAALLAEWRASQCSTNEEALKQIYDQLCEAGFIRQPEGPKEADELKNARSRRRFGKDIDLFRSPSGHEVIVGRSASANEQISFSLTLKNAWWFHTSGGVPGSHVTIRCPGAQVPKADVEFAAQIAAWHSKARAKPLVSVMYCQGHQLRKPRQRRTGQVQVTGSWNEIKVRPQLPDFD